MADVVIPPSRPRYVVRLEGAPLKLPGRQGVPCTHISPEADRAGWTGLRDLECWLLERALDSSWDSE